MIAPAWAAVSVTWTVRALCLLLIPESERLMTIPDASVTQSALEEALLSNMQAGGTRDGGPGGGASVASRMSSLSQALKSRYL